MNNNDFNDFIEKKKKKEKPNPLYTKNIQESRGLSCYYNLENK
jgi:hypothetical protein